MNAIKKPQITMHPEPLDKILLMMSALILAGFLLLVWMTWPDLPDQIPTHFDFSGNADAWGTKDLALILPLLALFNFTLLLVLSKHPHCLNYVVAITESNAKVQYQLASRFLLILTTLISGLLMVIYLRSYELALSKSSVLPGEATWVLVLMLMSSVGGCMYLSKRLEKTGKKRSSIKT